MKTKFISILAIFFGLIIVTFPLAGLIEFKYVIELSILLLSIYLLVVGISTIDYDKTGSIMNLALSLLMLLLSISLIFNPSLIGFLSQIIHYLAGIILIIVGLVYLINNRNSRYGFYIGVLGVVLGLVYIVVGTFIPGLNAQSILIGIWLIICGVLKFIDR